MDYLSIKQLSEKWGISKEEFKLCVQQGESPELKKVGYSWIIPDDAEKPVDARIKSGKYLKNKKCSEASE